MENLSGDVLCYMLDYVDLNDIIQFSKTSKYYNKKCKEKKYISLQNHYSLDLFQNNKYKIIEPEFWNYIITKNLFCRWLTYIAYSERINNKMYICHILENILSNTPISNYNHITTTQQIILYKKFIKNYRT